MEKTMKPLFDIQKSLKLCPPEDRPNLPKGARHKRRIVAKRKSVIYDSKNQVRYLSVLHDSASDIATSFQLNGYLHDEYPPVVTVNPNNPELFNGESGFTRDAAADKLGWETMIYDIYEFDTPLALRKFRLKSNKSIRPSKPNTKQDIINQTVSAIESGEIENTDDSIKEFIDDVADDKSVKERSNIFKSVRGRKSAHPSLITYHCDTGKNSTLEAAEKFNLPYSGDKRYTQTGKLGYIPSSFTPKTSFTDSKKLIIQYGYQDIDFNFFLPEPKMVPALYKQREDGIESFEKFKRTEAEWIQIIMEQFGFHKSVQEIYDVLPQKAKGFLPQYKDADPKKEGNPQEESVVDCLGNPIS